MFPKNITLRPSLSLETKLLTETVGRQSHRGNTVKKNLILKLVEEDLTYVGRLLSG